MAGPTYGTAGSYLESDTASPSFGAPSGVVADSVVVIAAYVDGTADPGISMASGWAHAPGSPVYEDDDPADGSSQNHRLVIAWHRASGSESGPYAPWTTTGSRFTSGQAHRVEGCKTSGDPFDTASDVAGKTLSVTDSPSVSITTGGADELVLHAATNWAGGPWTPSTGFTERQDGGSFHHCMLAEKTQTSAGSTGSVVATATGNNKSQAWLGALLPAASNLTADASATSTASPSATANTVQPASTSGGATTASASGAANVVSPASATPTITAAATPTAAAVSPAGATPTITAAPTVVGNTVSPADAAASITASGTATGARGDTGSLTGATVSVATVTANVASLASVSHATSPQVVTGLSRADTCAVVAAITAAVSARAALPGGRPGQLAVSHRTSLTASHI